MQLSASSLEADFTGDLPRFVDFSKCTHDVSPALIDSFEHHVPWSIYIHMSLMFQESVVYVLLAFMRKIADAADASGLRSSEQS